MTAIVGNCLSLKSFKLVVLMFFLLGLFVIIGLLVYTFKNWQTDVYFSWSYGGGWSTVALSIIAIVLIMADR